MSDKRTESRRVRSRGRIARRGARGPDALAVGDQFHLFTMEFLRALARGQSSQKATEALVAFVDMSGRARAPWADSIEQAVRRCDELIAERGAESELDRALFDLGRAGLLLMIEALAPDSLATAREAARSDALHRAVLRFACACERQARREGWSYVGMLHERLGPKTQADTSPRPN